MSRRSHAGGRVRHHNSGGRGNRDHGRPAAGPVRPASGRFDETPTPSPPLTSTPPAITPPVPPTPPADPEAAGVLEPSRADPPQVSPFPHASPGGNGHALGSGGSGCTAPQLRRFIKSRAYVPMHELRRRFAINGVEDDVTPVDLADGRIFVGLPRRESELLGELLRGGEVGFELSLDPRTPVVVGVYPMRPVPRG